ncbi:type II toxin-antitoxin system RelE/ParE family toxin [Calothrix sp. PCC 7507]|uniref:type II toxin-antitoxin system RelE/ParE family toxin n=1 Tax=Calothrix sp. PCC 7507 TaxID=99598 RepID=UPI00029F05E2|nr:type II toxin-antitoxin system RelE/ParE family toxin [Calothrix sp. PCC 7507]AFY34178.1 plasmid stabilization system [Calothrix sp. PCC 7507]
MAFQVRTTQTADAQIEAAYLWLREYNPAYADQWFRGLMNAIASLQEKPRRCILALEHEVFSEEVRQLIYGKSRNTYRILFTIRDRTVYVLYVRHTILDFGFWILDFRLTPRNQVRGLLINFRF